MSLGNRRRPRDEGQRDGPHHPVGHVFSDGRRLRCTRAAENHEEIEGFAGPFNASPPWTCRRASRKSSTNTRINTASSLSPFGFREDLIKLPGLPGLVGSSTVCRLQSESSKPSTLASAGCFASAGCVGSFSTALGPASPAAFSAQPTHKTRQQESKSCFTAHKMLGTRMPGRKATISRQHRRRAKPHVASRYYGLAKMTGNSRHNDQTANTNAPRYRRNSLIIRC